MMLLRKTFKGVDDILNDETEFVSRDQVEELEPV